MFNKRNLLKVSLIANFNAQRIFLVQSQIVSV